MTSAFPTERWFWFDPPFHPGPVGAAAPAGGRRVAHRLPARARRRSRAERQPERIAAAPSRDARRRRATSSSNGRASTRSSAGGCSASAMAACCSAATRRTSCRRSARAAPTAACRTPTTSAGSSTSWCAAARRSACSTPTTPSAAMPPTRTSATRPARPTSSRRRARSRARSATRCSTSRRQHPFARALVNSGRLSVPTLLAASPLNTADRAGEFASGPARWCPARPPPTRRSRARAAIGCSTTSAATSRC